MVEKWLQSNVARKPIPKRANPSAFSKNVASHYGTPIQLFKDSDKDGVMNVFDCKPHNKRKQDVIQPQNFGSGMADMLARQEYARQQKDYQNILKEIQKQEEVRQKEYQRQGIEVPTSSFPGTDNLSLAPKQIKYSVSVSKIAPTYVKTTTSSKPSVSSTPIGSKYVAPSSSSKSSSSSVASKAVSAVKSFFSGGKK